MRLGIVPYLNAIPLTAGLDCPVYKAAPARLASLAERNDIILAPTVTSFLEEGWYLLEGPCIGSWGAVETVKLFFNKTPHPFPLPEGRGRKPAKIYLDEESLTSAALIRILATNQVSLPFPNIEFTKKNREQADAVLLIGDKTWDNQPFTDSIDLGAAWTDWKKLPFVWACWMTRSPETGRVWKEKLAAQTKRNLERLDLLVEETLPPQPERTLRYWQRLRYFLGENQKTAVEAFQTEWAKTEKRPKIKLQWI
ncbi:MAG: MqnA/MqnD/SBP family protein [Deltaproteobacteria bacterium]|nr:MqnA/MqnD/SBP family protein [Deltaproteobacteria bacterium]